MDTIDTSNDVFNPDRWGLSVRAIAQLGNDLREYWARFRSCFRTRTRDTSEYAYVYLRGQLTMEDTRNYANIERRLTGGDGQGLQQFMTDSPWSGQQVFRQIQAEISEQPALQSGGVLILDESADAKSGKHSAGAARQRNGRLGKVDMCQVATNLALSSLIKSYRAKSHKVVPVKSLHIRISRQVDREKGNASWYTGSTSKGLSSPINAVVVNPWTARRIS